MGRPALLIKIDNLKDYSTITGNGVYQIYYDRVYIIVKALSIYQSLKALQKSMNQFLKKSPSAIKPKNLYWKWFDYIERHPDKAFRIKILFESNDGYKLLKFENHAIKKGLKTKVCLNKRNKGAYIPKWNPEKKMFNWIPAGKVGAYVRYKNKKE